MTDFTKNNLKESAKLTKKYVWQERVRLSSNYCSIK